MTTYEQIKKIAEAYEEHAHNAYYERSEHPTFDQWAAVLGKEMILSLLERADISTSQTGNFVQPSNTAPVSPYKEDDTLLGITKVSYDYPTADQILENGILPYPDEDKKECPACGCTEEESNLCAAHYCPFVKETDMDTDRHEALVREIAEEMYVKGKEMLGIRPEYHGAKEIAMDGIFIPMARIAVKRMADEFKAGYEQAARDYGYANAHNDSDIDAYLKERGLIPEKEDDSHESNNN